MNGNHQDIKSKYFNTSTTTSGKKRCDLKRDLTEESEDINNLCENESNYTFESNDIQFDSIENTEKLRVEEVAKKLINQVFLFKAIKTMNNTDVIDMIELFIQMFDQINQDKAGRVLLRRLAEAFKNQRTIKSYIAKNEDYIKPIIKK